MTLPSLNLLLQAILSGIFIGGLYGLIGLGLGLTWGLLRQINLSHFGLVFLGGYLSYQMAASWQLDPLLALLVVPPAFFAVGVAMQWVLSRFAITPFNSLLVTFGITVVIESAIQAIWTADYRRLESHYNAMKFTIGKLYVPIPELVTFLLALGISLAIWAGMRYTDLGKALRAMAVDGPIASAFGIDAKKLELVLAGCCAALAGVAGVCLALTFTLTPSQIFAWVGVVFAAVMLGGLGSALGPLVAGIVIGVSEAVTMAVASPSWAPIVSFSLLILMLLFRPGRAWR
ncbi:branched-chain amino acid ABC transporter permease [Ramlibacter sp. USB13]|uniref:Branched-chain amino acid ABC transporter permease n=1 Tax=Ramlibacter cellulosilyticus TaxID=2764187 RepID=A0A923SDF3_9BURK|nr:branched-chain amino acid ABC transporter permease [Ramlibacter cellulosilyticus]MBC5785263.1 branched-chain amino acid ABC transporter permease [Ramlibacter cellulosilyticus]